MRPGDGVGCQNRRPFIFQCVFYILGRRHIEPCLILHKLDANKLPTIFTLTHWGRVTHLCVSKLTSIASDNGLSPGRRQAIIWNNAGILLIGPLGTNFSEILIEILTFSFTKMRLKVSSAKRRPFCLGLNELNAASSWQGVWISCNFEMPDLLTQSDNILVVGAWINCPPWPTYIRGKQGIFSITHWGRKKWTPCHRRHSQVHLKSWMKMFELWSKFHWSLFLRVQLTILHNWFR